MKPQTTTVPTTTPALPDGLRRIVLTGFMGAGKTTVGRLLAERIGWTFLDLDTHLETRAGATIPQIFASEGEDRFRRLESTALASALTARSTVLALGGGTPEILTNRLLLEQTPGTLTIFLDAPFPILFDRCMLQELSLRELDPIHNPGQSRPVLANPILAEARFIKRLPLYRRLAHITLDIAVLNPPAAVDALLQALAQTK